jgi:hypothetical protein
MDEEQLRGLTELLLDELGSADVGTAAPQFQHRPGADWAPGARTLFLDCGHDRGGRVSEVL